MKDFPATGRSLLLAVAAVTTLTALAYAAAFDDGFVLDDRAAIAQHRGVVHPSLRDLLARDFWGGTRMHPRTAAFRPLTSASFAVDWKLGRGAPWMFHVTNVSLHVLFSLLVLFGLWTLENLRRRVAVAAALLFALHPLHTEAVAGLVGRADVLSALFVLIVWWLHRRGEGWPTLFAPLFLLLALLAKESALVVVPLLVLLDLRYESDARLMTRALRWLGYVAAIALALTLRAHVLGSWHSPPATSANPLLHATPTARLLTALSLFARAIKLHLLPFELIPDYGRAVVVPLEHADRMVLIGGGIVLLLVALLIFAWRRPGPLVDAIAFLLVPGLLAVNALVPLPVAFAERWWYLPSLGACVLMALLLDFIAARINLVIPAVVLGLMLALFTLVTFRRAGEWHDGETLFTACVATAPASALCQYSMATILDQKQQDKEALADYQRAEALDPDWAEPHAAAAAILARENRIGEAQIAFEKMRAAGGASTIARLNYARFLLRTGRVSDGQRELMSLQEVPSDEP